MEYTFYVADCETTGLDPQKHDIIELSIIRLSDEQQKTWYLKPLNPNSIDIGALKVNGHKIEDLLHQTAYGKEKYQDPAKVIIEAENWLMEDSVPAETRCLVGHNIAFDKYMMENLWSKCNSSDSFPFGRRVMDTMIFALMMDYAENTNFEGYHLANIIKKYGIKNAKAHSAEADVFVTKELFKAQIDELRKKLVK